MKDDIVLQSKKELIEYLEICIYFWRKKRDNENCEFAKYYIDAFQSVYISITGKTLD